jgi:acyl carrier protein
MAASPDRRLDLLAAHVRAHVQSVLRLTPTFTLNLDQGLFELGMDSLTALEVRNQLQQSLGLALPATVLFEHSTILALASFLSELLTPAIPAKTAPASAGDEQQELARLLAEVEALSEGEVDLELGQLSNQHATDGPSA